MPRPVKTKEIILGYLSKKGSVTFGELYDLHKELNEQTHKELNKQTFRNAMYCLMKEGKVEKMHNATRMRPVIFVLSKQAL